VYKSGVERDDPFDAAQLPTGEQQTTEDTMSASELDNLCVPSEDYSDCPERFSGPNCETECPPEFGVLESEDGNIAGCFFVINYPWLSWNDSYAECAKIHPKARLAVLDTREKIDTMREFIKSNYSDCYNSWTGARRKEDRNCSMPYLWYMADPKDNKPVTCEDYGPTQPSCGFPDTQYDEEDCITLWSYIEFQWNNWICDMQACAICEIL